VVLRGFPNSRFILIHYVSHTKLGRAKYVLTVWQEYVFCRKISSLSSSQSSETILDPLSLNWGKNDLFSVHIVSKTRKTRQLIDV